MPAVPPTIWKRRVALMAAVALLVAIPVTIAIRSGGDGSRNVLRSQLPKLGKTRSDSGLGVKLSLPKGWTRSKNASTIRLRSRDETTQIGISAPAPAGESQAVKRSALAAIDAGYRKVKVTPGSGREVGGLKAKGAVVSARNRKGTPLSILVAVARGKRRSYLVEVFTARKAPAKRLVEAQLVLSSLKLTG